MRRRYYNLFISHAWRHSDQYGGVVRLLNSVPRFYWKNYSVGLNDPIIPFDEKVSRRLLLFLLEEQISRASCFVLISGMYIYHRAWIQQEIDIAVHYEKPIVAVRQLGQKRLPVEIDDYADEIVGWRARSLAEGIRRAVRSLY